MEYQKIDNTTLKVIKPIEATSEENEYNIDELKRQEIAILKQKNEFVEARNKELVEVREMIAQCEKLGIKSELETEIEKEETIIK